MFPNGEGTFLSHDLHLLETMEFKQRINHIAEIIEEVQWQDIDPDMVTRFVDFMLPALHPHLHPTSSPTLSPPQKNRKDFLSDYL